MMRDIKLNIDKYSSHQELWREAAQRHRRVASALATRRHCDQDIYGHSIPYSARTTTPAPVTSLVPSVRGSQRSQRPATTVGRYSSTQHVVFVPLSSSPLRRANSAPRQNRRINELNRQPNGVSRQTNTSQTHRQDTSKLHQTEADTSDSENTVEEEGTTKAVDENTEEAEVERGEQQTTVKQAAKLAAIRQEQLNTYTRCRKAWNSFSEHVKSIKSSIQVPEGPKLPHLKYSDSFVAVVEEYIQVVAKQEQKTCDKPKHRTLAFYSSSLKVMAEEKRRREALRRWGLIREKLHEVISTQKKVSFDNWGMIRAHIKKLRDLENSRNDLYLRYGIIPNSEGKKVCTMKQLPSSPIAIAAIQRIRIRQGKQRLQKRKQSNPS